MGKSTAEQLAKEQQEQYDAWVKVEAEALQAFMAGRGARVIPVVEYGPHGIVPKLAILKLDKPTLDIQPATQLPK